MKTTTLSVRFLAILAAIAAMSNTPLVSQAFYVSVVGTVTDQSGAAPHGATVTTAANPATGDITTQINRQGLMQPAMRLVF